MLQNPCKTLGFKKNMVYKIPPGGGGEVNHIQPVAYYAHSCFAIIFMVKRELAALLSLSSWCLMIVVWLFLSVPWVCLQFVIVIPTYYFWVSFMRTAMALASLHICLV